MTSWFLAWWSGIMGLPLIWSILRSRTAGSYGNSVFDILRNCQTVSKVATPIYIPISAIWGFQFLCILAKSVTVCLITAILVIVICISLWFWFILPWWLWYWASFHALFGHLYSFFAGMYIQILCLFLKISLLSFYYWVVSFLYIV